MVMVCTAGCGLTSPIPPTVTASAPPPAATFTPIPTYTPIPTGTTIPGSVVLDFAAQLCNAKWMNNAQKFSACPDANADHSTGYGVVLDPAPEGWSAATPVLMTLPAWNGYQGLFLRFPALKIEAGDRFRATLQCRTNSTECDVEFALEYYDANGKYHSPFGTWNQNSGMAPTPVDYDLGALSGQNVELTLVIRPNNDSPQLDAALWIAPQIFRPNP